jgi:septal ring factor EnvC (AmiA/AmiB activator)
VTVRLGPARRVLLALALLVGTVETGLAQEDSLERANRMELERVRREAAENRAAAQRLKGQETKALGQLRRTERDLNQTRKRLRTLQLRRKRLDQNLSKTRASLQRSTGMLQEQRDKLGARLRNMYKYGAARELEFLLSPRSFAQLLARWDFVVMVAEQDRMLLEDIQAKKEIVEADQQRLELNLTDVVRTSKRTTAEDRRLAGLRQQRASTVQTIKTQRETYEAAAAELERTARAIQRLIQNLERKRREESDRARAQGRAPQPYTGDFGAGRGSLDWPVHGDVIGRFGPEKHPKWGTTTLNNGVDISAPIGSAVRAVAKGRVDYVSEEFGAFGQIIIINHGDGYYTLYGHLSEIGVSVGQEVAAGHTIARSGDTGSLKGSILHFEVRKGGTPLDPEDWLR